VTPRIAFAAALLALGGGAGLGAASCGPGGPALSIAAEGGAAPREVRVGDTLRLAATLGGEGGAAPRTVTSATDLVWRVRPTGVAAFAPGDDERWVTVTFLKEGAATIWATYGRTDSQEELHVAVRR
jgi:hypothetical protein